MKFTAIAAPIAFAAFAAAAPVGTSKLYTSIKYISQRLSFAHLRIHQNSMLVGV